MDREMLWRRCFHQYNVCLQHGHTSFGTCRDKKEVKEEAQLRSMYIHLSSVGGSPRDLGSCDEHLIDGESDGEESGPLMTLHPSTFLHQSHNDGAGHLPVLRVIVLLVQLQPILRVSPICVWKTQEVNVQQRRYDSSPSKDTRIWSILAFRRVKYEKKQSPTWEVPAAACRAASHPAALIDRHRPAVSFVTLKRVGGQVAHLQLCEVLLEIVKRHPGGEHERGCLLFAPLVISSVLKGFCLIPIEGLRIEGDCKAPQGKFTIGLINVFIYLHVHTVSDWFISICGGIECFRLTACV